MTVVIRVLAGMLVVLLGLLGFLTYSIYSATRSAGFIYVEVDPKGFQPPMYVPFPAIFVNGIADAVSFDGIDCHDCELREWRPAVRAALQEFERYPDIVLVDVHNRDDHVRVRKAGRQLIVEVDNHEVDVRIAIPHTTVRKLANALTSATDVNVHEHDCDGHDHDWGDGSLDV